jgi:hypothetical protein
MGSWTIRQQVQTPTREEHWIDVVQGQGLFEDERLVPRGSESLEFLGLHGDVSIWAVSIAADNGGCVHWTVVGAALLMPDALAAAGVELVELRLARARDGCVGFDGNRDQAEPEQAGPARTRGQRGRSLGIGWDVGQFGIGYFRWASGDAGHDGAPFVGWLQRESLWTRAALASGLVPKANSMGVRWGLRLGVEHCNRSGRDTG